MCCKNNNFDIFQTLHSVLGVAQMLNRFGSISGYGIPNEGRNLNFSNLLPNNLDLHWKGCSWMPKMASLKQRFRLKRLPKVRDEAGGHTAWVSTLELGRSGHGETGTHRAMFQDQGQVSLTVVVLMFSDVVANMWCIFMFDALFGTAASGATHFASMHLSPDLNNLAGPHLKSCNLTWFILVKRLSQICVYVVSFLLNESDCSCESPICLGFIAVRLVPTGCWNKCLRKCHSVMNQKNEIPWIS